MLQEDANAGPEYGERLPYVIHYGNPKSSIRDQAIHPLEMLRNQDLLLHGRYYIRRKIIPPLMRVFNLIGVDVMQWFDAMRKPKRTIRYGARHGRTIDFFFKDEKCVVCNATGARDGICMVCSSVKVHESVYSLEMQMRQAELEYTKLVEICRQCMGHCRDDENVYCESLDCAKLYERVKGESKLRATGHTFGDVIRRFSIGS